MFDKLFSKPILKVVIIGFIGLVMIYVLLCVFDDTTKVSNTVVTTDSKNTDYRYLTTLEYTKSIESRIKSFVMQMGGVSNVSVMVSVDGTTSYEYLSVDGKVMFDDDYPIVVSETLPNVSSVTIVASGLSVVNKVNITRAVSALFNLSTDDIFVLTG